MAATPYRPISFNDKSLTKEKLQQLANNDQWLFENTPRVRYNYSQASIVKDSGIKIMSGKVRFGTSTTDYIDTWVMFGNFFSAACKPAVTVTIETSGFRLRKFATIRNVWGGGEVDHRGFTCHISDHETSGPVIEAGGWIHWMAVGF